MSGPEIGFPVAALPQEIHVQIHQFRAETNSAVIRLDQKIAQLGGVIAIHQEQKTDHPVLVFAGPNAVASGFVFLVKLTQTFRHVTLKLNPVVVLPVVQRAMHIRDIADIARSKFSADRDIIESGHTGHSPHLVSSGLLDFVAHCSWAATA
jgi:hypothetical protein